MEPTLNIAWCIARLRPDLESENDYSVVDYSDGEGQRLLWHTDGPEPTYEEMRAAHTDILRDARRESIVREAREERNAIWDIPGSVLPPDVERERVLLMRAAGATIPAADRARATEDREVIDRLARKLTEVDQAEYSPHVMLPE